MNEINLANITQDATPETGNAPKGFAQAVNQKNDCKYEFTLRIQRQSKDVYGGKMTFTLPAGFGTLDNIDTEGTDTLIQDPTTKVWTWTFGTLTTGAPNRTVTFDSLYAGDADVTILTDVRYSGQFTDDPTDTFGVPDALDAQITGSNKTKKGCEPPARKPPKVSVLVRANRCSYHFTFTAKWDGTDVSGGTLNFALNNGFADPINVVPAAELSYIKPNGIWTFGALNGTTQTRTLEFDAIYTGAASQPVFTGTITFIANYVSGGNTGNTTVTPIGNTTTAQQCPDTTKPCCEACSNTSVETVSIEPCEDYVEAPIEVAVAPKGRRLSVHLNLPEVCDKKDVNVGVFVSEVFNSGTNDEREVPFAHKVIRRPATTGTGGCKDDRGCDCVDFMIDDTNPCAGARTFRVRTQAHYLDTNADDVSQQCQCNCPTV